MKKYIFSLGIFSLFLFFIFSYSVQHGGFKRIDFDTTVKLQDTIDKSRHLRLTALIDETMEGATFFASPEVSVVVVLLLTGVFLYDFKKKKFRLMALSICFFFFLVVLAEIYGKSVVHHPAPPFFMIKNPTTFFPKYYINDQFSYPSGHVARAIFLSLAACFGIMQFSRFTKKTRLILCIAVISLYVGLVSISRIYLGHHWLSDIIGGIFLGVGMNMFAITLLL